MSAAQLPSILPRVSRAALWLALVAVLLILLGWALRIEFLIRLVPGQVAMNPVTAATFALAAVSVLLRLPSAATSSQRKWVGIGLGGLVLLTGILALAAYLGCIRFRVDQLLFGSRLLLDNPRILSEMAPNTALAFLFLGLALVLFDAKNPQTIVSAQAATLAAGLVTLLVLIGYSYRELVLYRVGTASPMALDTAMALALLCFALLACRPDTGLMRMLTSHTAGGIIARRLLPMAVAVPWILGALLLAGEAHGYFEREVAVAIFAITSIVVFTCLIWWHAKLLHLDDLERSRAQRRVAAQHQATRLLAESSQANELLPKLLQVLCETMGWPLGLFWKADLRTQTLACRELWHKTRHSPDTLLEACRAGPLAKGAELPGRIWSQAQPLWEAQDERSPLTRAAAQAGLHAALGLPVWAGEEFFGVLEFFTPEASEPEPALLDTLSAVATQLGLFLERTRAEEQVRLTSANLQRSNTDLQQFAYIASHDLFEPLRMITSYLELLNERYADRLDERGREFMAFALDGAHRMDALIRDLLAYSRVEIRGRSFQPVDCRAAFAAAIANLKVAIDESGATITNGDLPTVQGDSVQLTQVFQNLLGNAIKFRGPEPPRIEVTAERRNQEWLFRVHDNGIGIDPKQFSRLFVIFQRLHTRQEYAGTGMGLAICKKIVERHGGRIWVESAPGQGTTFLFTLPAGHS